MTDIAIQPAAARSLSISSVAPHVSNIRPRRWLRKSDLNAGCDAQEAAEIEKMRAAGWRPEWSGV
jgi:hypothetical protein